jgi:hypothetical protein
VRWISFFIYLRLLARSFCEETRIYKSRTLLLCLLAGVQFSSKINILFCIFTSPRKVVLRRDLNMQNKDIILVPWLYHTRFLPGTTRPSWLVFAKDCLPGICIIL